MPWSRIAARCRPGRPVQGGPVHVVLAVVGVVADHGVEFGQGPLRIAQRQQSWAPVLAQPGQVLADCSPGGEAPPSGPASPSSISRAPAPVPPARCPSRATPCSVEASTAPRCPGVGHRAGEPERPAPPVPARAGSWAPAGRYRRTSIAVAYAGRHRSLEVVGDGPRLVIEVERLGGLVQRRRAVARPVVNARQLRQRRRPGDQVASSAGRCGQHGGRSRRPGSRRGRCAGSPGSGRPPAGPGRRRTVPVAPGTPRAGRPASRAARGWSRRRHRRARTGA